MVGIPTPARCALDGCDRLGVCIPNAQAHSAAPFKKHGSMSHEPLSEHSGRDRPCSHGPRTRKPRSEFRSYCAETGQLEVEPIPDLKPKWQTPPLAT